MYALGISVHTGWGACVVVGGSLHDPRVVGNKVVELLDDAERFCYHRAAEMKTAAAPKWLARMRAKALERARRELAPLLRQDVRAGAIVAKEGALPELDWALGTHMRLHSAEGLFYRDVFRDACQISCRIIPPASLDLTAVGKLATSPWGRDQKLAALAAWQVMGH